MAMRGGRRLERWLRAAALGACLAAPAAWAQQPPARPAFTIDVRSPDREVRELLQKHLELQRFRDVPDLEDVELDRLLGLAERDARGLLGTLGYFSPRLDIRREPGAGGAPPVVVIDVEPGTPTTVAETEIRFQGDIQASEDPQAILQRAEIRERWTLAPGRRFTQDAWDDAKQGAVRALVARRYPAGKIGESRADIDAGSNRARLGLRLDSGPLFRLGPLQVTGVERYDPVLVPRLAALPAGAIYDTDQIQRAQLRLTGSGYYDSAFIYVDPQSDPAAAPVQVNVREAPLHKLVLGLGVSTDSGPRATAEYTHNRVPGLGWRSVTRMQIDRKTPFFETELQAIPDERRWRWGGLARIEQQDDGNLVTDNQRVRIGRSKTDERIDRNVYLQFDNSVVHAKAGEPPPQDTGDGASLSVNAIWNGRYLDRTPYPTQGFTLGAEVGGGLTLTGTRSPFQRTVLRWLEIHPLTSGRLQWRAEGGAVIAREAARVPAAQLFRTGGDTSVRGYGLREIGVDRGGGVISPGRYLAVGSIEWQRPIRRDGVETNFESALFVDAGAVADRVADLRPAYGVGAGVRVRSPLGPVQVDLAYGVKVHRFRLHFNLGTTF